MAVDEHTSDRQRLDEALATGPFSLALRLAVRASGLSLDRLQFKLKQQGTPVSKTALSYWQHGRTQPERPESLRALAAIEELLGVEPGALVALLGPPRPRGRWLTQKPGTMRPDQAWARPDGLTRALQRMGTNNDAFHWLAPAGVHTTVNVGADRTMRSIEHRLVLRAERDEVDRRIVAHRTDVASSASPRVTRLAGCRLGRMRRDEPTGFTLFELLLDRRLRAGELTVLEYTVELTPLEPDTIQTQRVGKTVRDLSMQVRFDPATLPVRVFRTYRSTVSETARQDDLWLGGSSTSHFAVVDPDPGIYAVAWEWD